MGTKEIVERFIKVHGNEYDYSKVEYTKMSDKVEILCKKHGSFFQEPHSHLKGCGCKLCSIERRSSGKRYTTGKYIKKAKELYGDKYDYSKTIYKSSKEKICVICPRHGEFYVKADDHLNNNRGCPLCYSERRGLTQKLTTDDFVNKAKLVHNNKYDYSKVNYVDARTKVCIICPTHGEFWQAPLNHLTNKTLCPKCSKIYRHSELEETIFNYLKEAYPNLTITREKTFEWLKNKNNLLIDFFIEEHNIAIEVQGEQHYKPIQRFGGIEGFERRKFLDHLKKELCDGHGIRIIYVSSKRSDIIKFKNNLKNILYETSSTQANQEKSK